MNLMICVGCGDWADAPVVAETAAGEAVLVCARCGHRQPFRRLPLFALTGPSGTGKSTVGRLLGGRLGESVLVLEQDLLWVDALREPADDFGAFRQTWLRMIAMLNQSGRPSVLCGTVVPPQWERRPERALLGEIHYLALDCADEVLRERLRARPAWREWDERRIDEMLEFARWVRTNAATTSPPMRRLDTTSRSVEETADEVAAWIRALLPTAAPTSQAG